MSDFNPEAQAVTTPFATEQFAKGVERGTDLRERERKGKDSLYELVKHDSPYSQFCDKVTECGDYLEAEQAVELLEEPSVEAFIVQAESALGGEGLYSRDLRYNIAIAIASSASPESGELKTCYGEGKGVSFYLDQLRLKDFKDINHEQKAFAHRKLLLLSVGDTLGLDLTEYDRQDYPQIHLPMIIKTHRDTLRTGKLQMSDVQKNYAIYTLVATYASELAQKKTTLKGSVSPESR